MVGGGTELVVSEGETAAAGSGARPGLPAAGQEPAVNADKENKVMYSPAVRRIFTSCANREGSKRAARIKIWYGHCAAVSERSAVLYQSGAQASRSHSSSWRVRYFFRLRKTWRW